MRLDAAPRLRPARGEAGEASVVIRRLGTEHLGAVTAIYRAQIASGFGSLEDPLPDEAEMGRRLADVLSLGLPALAATDADGDVLGYGWVTPFRLRAHYDHTVEDSLHVAATSRGRGIGRQLLVGLIAAATAAGCRQMIAVVGDARNRASIRLHETCGFVGAGWFPGVGCKEGKPTDVVMLQRSLGRPGRR
ncbi:MAG: N-acetyltransferase family protein [Pseudomonadota bacterium]